MLQTLKSVITSIQISEKISVNHIMYADLVLIQQSEDNLQKGVFMLDIIS